MTSQELLAAFEKLNKHERVRFLLRLSHKLTVIARDTYYRGEVHEAARLIGVNEFQHRLVAMILDLVDGQAVRTDAEIAEYLVVGFSECGASRILEEALVQ